MQNTKSRKRKIRNCKIRKRKTEDRIKNKWLIQKAYSVRQEEKGMEQMLNRRKKKRKINRVKRKKPIQKDTECTMTI